MAAPLIGRRVKIDGLASKPELNGTEGLAVSFDDGKGRYNCKLDATGGMMALKPANLTAADGGAGAGGGGMPGMGGMPGFGGGMPGGMGGMPGMGGGGMAAMLAPLLAKLFGAGGAPQLPGGLSPQQLGIGLMLIVFVLPRMLGIGMMPLLLLGGAGGFVYVNAKDGQGPRGMLAAGKRVVHNVGEQIGRATGRPVSDAQALMLLAAGIFLLYRSGWLSLSSSSATDDGEAPGYAAYSKGYQDGQAGRRFDPISDPDTGSGRSSSSSWGIGSILNLVMVGSMLMQMAGSPPSVQNLMANAKHMNPMQMIILVQVLSGLFF